MADEKQSNPGTGLVKSKKYAFAVLFVTTAIGAFLNSTNVTERCVLACAAAFVVVGYMIAQAMVEREAVEHGAQLPDEINDSSVIINTKQVK